MQAEGKGRKREKTEEGKCYKFVILVTNFIIFDSGVWFGSSNKKKHSKQVGIAVFFVVFAVLVWSYVRATGKAKAGRKGYCIT